MSVFGALAARNAGTATINSFLSALKKRQQDELAQQRQMAELQARFQQQRQLAQLQNDLALRRLLAQQLYQYATEAMKSGRISPEQAKQVISLAAQGDVEGALVPAATLYTKAAQEEFANEQEKQFSDLLGGTPLDEQSRKKAMELYRTGGLAAVRPFLASQMSGAKWNEFSTKLEGLKLSNEEKRTRLDFLAESLQLSVEGQRLNNKMSELLVKDKGNELAFANANRIADLARKDPEQVIAMATNQPDFLRSMGVDPDAALRAAKLFKAFRDEDYKAKVLGNEYVKMRNELFKAEKRYKELELKAKEGNITERERLEMEKLRKDVEMRRLDVEMKTLDALTKQDEFAQFKDLAGLRLAARIRKLTEDSPDLAASFVDKNRDKLEQMGIDPDAMKKWADLQAKLKKYEDPQRKEAIAVWQGWLDKPPKGEDEQVKTLAEVRSVLEKAGVEEPVINNLLDQLRAAWSGQLSAAELARIKAKAELAKYKAEGMKSALDALNKARMSLEAERKTLDAKIGSYMERLLAAGCATKDPFGAIILENTKPECKQMSAEAQAKIGKELMRYNTISANLAEITNKLEVMGGITPIREGEGKNGNPGEKDPAKAAWVEVKGFIKANGKISEEDVRSIFAKYGIVPGKSVLAKLKQSGFLAVPEPNAYETTPAPILNALGVETRTD